MDTSTLVILAMLAGKLIIIGLWFLAGCWIVKTILLVIEGAFRVKEINQQAQQTQLLAQTQLLEQTHLHYSNLTDRYFDYQKGLWYWKPEYDPALQRTSHA